VDAISESHDLQKFLCACFLLHIRHAALDQPTRGSVVIDGLDLSSVDDDLERVYTLFPRLKERDWQLAGTLSGGEQQMLAVGRALMSRPKLLMMDEPSLGLAPLIVKDIFDIIRTINKEGITVLLIEQNANHALKIADWAYVMETGNISMQGTGEELLTKDSIKEAYLGKRKK